MKKKKNRYKRNLIDCSEIADKNPTRLLQDASHDLQKISCLETLKTKMTMIMEKSTVSRKNLLKFFHARDRINSLTEMQMYLYNYILAGSALQTRFEK